jgi:transposase
MANNLETEKKVLAISMLAEGNSIRSIERMTGIHRDTIMRLAVRVRMHCRRLTRLTNAFSKKFENFQAAMALNFAYYNFCKTHSSLRMTPAQAAGVESSPWTVAELVERCGE